MPSIVSRTALLSAFAAGLTTLPARAQIDSVRAQRYFSEAAARCETVGTRLWGVSLCGPMVFADPRSGVIVANETVPDAPRPAALGFANTALRWGDRRWSTFVWQIVPVDSVARLQLMLHELFHRVQPDLGLFRTDLGGDNAHLDTVEGRYWLRLEWRALAAALSASGAERLDRVRDALAFRLVRRGVFAGSAVSEAASEINEGLAQYTAVVGSAGTLEHAWADAVTQLGAGENKESFVRTFSYSSGAAYGLLLDDLATGWRTGLTADSDLGKLLMERTDLEPSSDPGAASARYGGPAVLTAERERETKRQERLVELRRRFVDGPVLTIPRGRGASFVTAGITPIPGVGTVFPSYRVTGPWGRIEAELVLVAPDGATITVPGPVTVRDRTATGGGWTVTLEPGWVVKPGTRAGDARVVRDSTGGR